MLGAALVIALATGFALAFMGEMRYPRVAHVREGEAVSGARVLSSYRAEHGGGARAAPGGCGCASAHGHHSESYRTLYLHLAATGARFRRDGDRRHPAVVATIATNLAAVAAYEARSALLVDGTQRRARSRRCCESSPIPD